MGSLRKQAAFLLQAFGLAAISIDDIAIEKYPLSIKKLSINFIA
jgi:hypothetical protein